MPPYSLSHPQSHDQSKMVSAMSSISLSQPRSFASSMINHTVSMQCPGLMVRVMLVLTNSPFMPTVSSKHLYSGWMKYFLSFAIDSSICAVSFGSLTTLRMHEPTLMRIMMMLWLWSCTFGSNFSGRKPGVLRKRCVSSNIWSARCAQCWSPVARAYSDIAIEANVSEKT